MNTTNLRKEFGMQLQEKDLSDNSKTKALEAFEDAVMLVQAAEERRERQAYSRDPSSLTFGA